MRIGLATPDWPSFTDGGVATLAQVLATGLRSEGHSVEVWTRGGGRRTTDGDGGRSFPGRNWRTHYQAHWQRGAVQALGEFAPEAIVSMSWEATAGLLLALGEPAPTKWSLRAQRSRTEIQPKPQLWTFAHGRDITGDPGPGRRAVRDALLTRNLSWFCLSPWMRQQLGWRAPRAEVVQVPAAVAPPPGRIETEGAAGRQGRRIPPGPSTLAPGSPLQPSLTILSLGRLIPRKGHRLLINALAELSADRPHLRLDVVGQGPEEPSLRRQVAALGLEDCVRFWGYVDSTGLEERFAAADLFVLPTQEGPGGDAEGFGLVFLEAGARGLAVIGGRTGGVSEAIRHGETGLLCSPTDSLTALCEALRRLLDQPELRQRLGAAGALRVVQEAQPEHLARGVLSVLSRNLSKVKDPMSGRERGFGVGPEAPPWVFAVRAAMPSPRPQAWQSLQQAVAFAACVDGSIPLVADACLAHGGPSALVPWLGHPKPAALNPHIPDRWSRPPLAGFRFRRSLAALRHPQSILWCRDARVAAHEAGRSGNSRRWRAIVLEWHVRPRPEDLAHRNALAATILHVPVAEGLAADLRDCGVPESQVALVPNACGLARDRALQRARTRPRGRLPILALGLHRRPGLDEALVAWAQQPDLPPLWIGGLDVDGLRVNAWRRKVQDNPRLQGRVRFVGPVWGPEREDLLDRVGLWLALYPRDEDSEHRLCPLQVVDAVGSGLPVVASDLPSVRDALHGQQAVLVPPGDPQLLVHGLQAGLAAQRNPHAAEVPRWKDRALALQQAVQSWVASAP